MIHTPSLFGLCLATVYMGECSEMDHEIRAAHRVKDRVAVGYVEVVTVQETRFGQAVAQRSPDLSISTGYENDGRSPQSRGGFERSRELRIGSETPQSTPRVSSSQATPNSSVASYRVVTQ